MTTKVELPDELTDYQMGEILAIAQANKKKLLQVKMEDLDKVFIGFKQIMERDHSCD